MVEPYKSEILPFWRFRTHDIASRSAQQIFILFLKYLYDKDFVGADMARKFLQMGYTRSRRHANHPTGKKYLTNPQKAERNRAEKRHLASNKRLGNKPQGYICTNFLWLLSAST